MSKKFREVRKVLRANGWIKVRQAGSHETWLSADGTQVVTVAGKGSDTVPTGTLAALRKRTGLRDLR
jgi:predicted RNA binding protein YcfA (HicA-like mRNA interferase family)